MKKKRSIGILLFAILLGFSLFLSSPVHAKSVFKDLERVKWAEKAIYYLSDKGIISGYGNGLFGPSDQITRAQAATMLVRDLYPNEQPSTDPGFKDVSKGDFYYKPIALAAEKGLLNGYNDDTFRGEKYISRAETAVLINKAYGIQKGNHSVNFTDVASNKWYTSSIINLASQQIINGYADGTFKPNHAVTRAEFSVILANTINPVFRTPTEESVENTTEAYDLKQLLADDFLSYASQGRIKPIEFGIGSSLQDVFHTYGPPLEKGDYQHVTDYFYYGNVIFFNYDDRAINPSSKANPDEVIGIFVKVQNGTINDVISALGIPYAQYKDELFSGYVLEYVSGGYLIVFRDVDNDQKIDEIEIWEANE